MMSVKDLAYSCNDFWRDRYYFFGCGVFLSQFAEFIPYEWMFEEISGFIKFGLLIVGIAVFLRISCQFGGFLLG